MTGDMDPPAERLSLGELDDLDEEYEPEPGSQRWALHAPEAYAIAALVVAVLSIMAPLQDFQLALFFNRSPRTYATVLSGLRIAIAALALLLAYLSMRVEDEDSTWSSPMARAALIVGVLAGLLAVASLITARAQHEPTDFGIAGPGFKASLPTHV